MDDLDDVRAYLGYDRINVYGGSYGTRAALVYLRQHGDHVRSMILDGVAPMDMRLPLFTARDAQRALDKLLARLRDATPAARRRSPDCGARPRAAAAARAASADRCASSIRAPASPRRCTSKRASSPACCSARLYSPLTASIVPALIDRAEHNDFQACFALGLGRRWRRRRT